MALFRFPQYSLILLTSLLGVEGILFADINREVLDIVNKCKTMLAEFTLRRTSKSIISTAVGMDGKCADNPEGRVGNCLPRARTITITVGYKGKALQKYRQLEQILKAGLYGGHEEDGDGARNAPVHSLLLAL